MKPLRDMSLTTKFFLGIGFIVIFFWCLFNVLIYFNLKDTSINQTYEKTDILFSHIQATVQYIRKQVRPKLFHILPEDSFIPEAMSVSFMNKGIMSEFKKSFPDFEYRRVAINPMNPRNSPNKLDLRYIGLFRNEKIEKIREVVKQNGKRYFIQARPIVIEKECLLCHGDPANAPVSLVRLCGKKRGFYRTAGEIIGVESIAIPMDEAFLQIKGLVFSIFLTGIVGVVFLFLSVNYYINIVAVKPIKDVSRFFKSVVKGEKDLDTRVEVASKDEIGELAEAFNRMMAYLKNSQDKMKGSELKYRRIFEGSKDTILIADCEGFIQDVNPAGLELFGCEDKSNLIRHKTFYDIFINKDDYTDFLDRMKNVGFVKDYETQLRGIDGGLIDVLITANFRKDDDGEICGFEAIVKDISEWKRVQDRLKEADRLASIGQLAAGLAHELNNPLGIILGYSGILLKELREKDGVRSDIGVISRNAETCKRIVEDLLKFSRRTETRPELLDIHRLIDGVVEMLSYQVEVKGVNIARKYSSSVPEVMLDREKMRQVFMNIIVNAIQAVSPGGEIVIESNCNQSQSRIFISVRDNGVGILEEIRGRIFEPFFTTKEPGEGTGLGLSVSYGIVKEHHGDIIVESEVGRGSTFTVSLPMERGVRSGHV